MITKRFRGIEPWPRIIKHMWNRLLTVQIQRNSIDAVQQLEFCTPHDGERQGRMTQPCVFVGGGMGEVPRNWMLASLAETLLLK
jgi:hypothetical protein